jgi:hypothetical protein
MGVILDELRRLLERQLNEHGIVVWFDPERHYEAVLAELNLAGTVVLRYTDSFYRLRHEAEPWIRQAEKPRLLVYVPLEYEAARGPLAELITFGETLRPGEKGLANTRLAVIARRALKPFLSESQLAALEREIEQNKLSLAELEDLARGGCEPELPTVLRLIYDAQQIEDVALSFLAGSDRDTQLLEKSAAGELAEMLKRCYGAPVADRMPLAETRATLARHVLCTELVLALGDLAPAALRTTATPKDAGAAERCAQLARAWRNRLDLGTSYVDAAREVERSLHLETLDLPFSALTKVETFAETERQLLRQTARRLAEGPDEQAEEVARTRRGGFWAARQPEFQARWDLLVHAASLLRLCGQLQAELKRPLSAAAIAEAYTAGPQAWCRLDTSHRLFEKKASSLEFLLTEQPAEIENLITVTRQRYAETANLLAEAFVRALAAASFELPGWYRQTQVFERNVAPQLEAGRRVAYLMVDALRYELARELAELLEPDFEVELEAVCGTMPGITEVGMAALLPHAATGLAVRAGKRDGLEVAIGGEVLQGREDRIAYLKRHAGAPVVALKLEDPKQFKSRLRKLEAGPVLVVVSSRELDQIAEEELTEARRYMDDVLAHVRLALYLLAKAGIEYFVVATDHGYLFGEELAESQKIDAPGGSTALLHRRVWVGQGGAASGSYLRTALRKLGVESELEIAVPWNLAGFKAGGSAAYFHGGLSPQELLLPVLRLRPKASLSGAEAKRISWELKLGSAKITAMHLTVTVAGRAGLFEAEWPRVRVEVRAAGEPCAIAVSASYNFSETTGEVALRSLPDKPGEIEPNAVTLMLTPKAPRSGVVSVHLLDAVSGVELARLDRVEVSRVF